MTEVKTNYSEEVLIKENGFDDHFHDHHHGDKYQSNFITTYIFSQDHKMIAKQFLITGMFWAIIGAAMDVYNNLGPGFLEAVYQEAMEVETTARKIPALPEQRL